MAEKQRIRVAHVVGSLTYGGAENQVIRLTNGLNDKVFERYLVTFAEKENNQAHLLSSHVKLHNLGSRRLRKLFDLYRFLRLARIRVLQSHMYPANLYASIAGTLASVPVIITTEHGRNPWKRFRHHMVERLVINRLVSLRVAVSKDILNIRTRDDHVPPGKIIHIPNCVDVPEKPLSLDNKDDLTVGTVGRLVKAKDYPALLHATKKVLEEKDNARLVFIGDGPERASLQDLSSKLGIRHRVEFAGWQSDVNRYLRRMDVFVLSSITEGIPVALLEAMALGLPVVCTRVGGIPEVIEDGKDGLLVDSGNPDKLADVILRVLEDRDLARSLGQSAREKIIRFFSTETICGRYEAIYRDLLEGKRDGQ